MPQISIHLTNEQLAYLDQYAAMHGYKTRSAALKGIISELLVGFPQGAGRGGDKRSVKYREAKRLIEALDNMTPAQLDKFLEDLEG